MVSTPIGQRKNLLYGVQRFYLAPYTVATDTAEPNVADTVTLGTDWGGGWVLQGFTTGGLVMDWKPKTNDMMVEESSIPGAIAVDTIDLSLSTELAEATLANMKTAFGGGKITVTAPGVGQPGKSVLTLSSSLDVLCAGFEGTNAVGMPRRVYIPKVISVADVKTNFRRAADLQTYPTTLRAICDPTQVVITDITAAATS
jgi:hypothetical protein